MTRKAPKARKAPKPPALNVWSHKWRIGKRGKHHYIMSGKAEVCRIAPGLHKDFARLIRSAPEMRSELDSLVRFIGDDMPGVVFGIMSNHQN
jgi:hypothetical protein